jgi:predicted transcriptional regulator
MDIASICRREIVTIDQDATLQQAANLMRTQHVGALVVTAADERPRVVGMVTDRDLAIEILARNLAGGDVRIGHLANRKLAAVPGTAGVAEAVSVMHSAGVRRLLVTENDGQLLGIVSTDDLLDAITGELSGLASALRAGIARESAERKAISPVTPRPVFLPQGTAGWSG